MKTRLRKINEKMRLRIRVIIWKQSKNNRKCVRSFEQLGIVEEEVKGSTYCRKGYRSIGNAQVIPRARSNERLTNTHRGKSCHECLSQPLLKTTRYDPK